MSIYDNLIANVEQNNGIPSGLLSSLLAQESSFNPDAYNPSSGAEGIAQIIPSTAADPGYGISPVDPTNPAASISFAGQYLTALQQATGSWLNAVQAYGTVPSSGPLTSGQQNVASAASAADNGYTPAQIRALPQVGFVTQAYDWLTGQPSGTTVQSQATNVGLRIGTAALAMIFITTGLAAIAFGSVTRGASRIVQKLPLAPVE